MTTSSVLLAAPDHFTHPEWDVTLGPEVGEVAEMAGIPPYPEQQMLLDETFALDRENPDRPASFSIAAIAARQQLKTGLLKQFGLGWLFVMPQPLIVWTAHEFSTAQEALNDMIGLIASNPDLDRRVAKVRTGSIAPSIEILPQYGGARLLFKARTGSGGRGLTGSKVILDEGFALEAGMMGALLPTMISKDDGQVVYASSAGLAKSATLRGVRDRGRAGSPRMTYAEWLSERQECATRVCDHTIGTPGCALDDMDLWRKACFITARRDWDRMGVIADLRRDLPPDEFMRECLGWWDEPLGDAAIPERVWSTPMLDPKSKIAKDPVFAIDVAPDRSWAGIVVAGQRADGHVHVEITSNEKDFDYRPGTSWLRFRLRAIKAKRGSLKVHIAQGSAAESLVPDLEEDGIHVERIPNADVIAACGRFYDLAHAGRLRHLGQDELTTAVTGARQKHLGERAFVWIRAGSMSDISPLYAATLAVWKVSGAQYDPLANIF